MRLSFPVILGCILVATIGSTAQDLPNTNYIPPSPTAAAFNRYGEIPVDMATGVPNISIPIFTLQEGGIKVPISISYHASGIKVRDVASEVGLGWVLNAGGVITQTALGLLDRQPAAAANPTNYYNTHIMDSVVGLDQTNDIENNSNYIFTGYVAPNIGFDMFSDRYYYSLATGESGVFRKLFRTDSFLTIPYAPTQIQFSDNQYRELELTPKDGTHHFFDMTYLDLFRLSKIVSVDGADSVMFYSHAVRYIHYNYYDVARFGDPVTIDGQLQYLDYIGQVQAVDDPNCTLQARTIQNTAISLSENGPDEDGDFVIVDSIVSSGTRILFSYANDRQDCVFMGTLPRLSEIHIYDKLNNKLINVVNFSQSYFSDGVPNDNRLRLDGVQIGANQEQKYSFVYNPDLPLPSYPESSRMFFEDFWGYYNGASGTTQIPDAFCQRGMNRMPNERFAKADIIQEIDYPTGGKTIFTFEGNRVDRAVYNFTPTGAFGEDIPADGLVGGLRLKQMATYSDNTSPPIVKTYTYGYDYYSWLGQISPESFVYQETDFNDYFCNCFDPSAQTYTYSNDAVSSPFYPLLGMGGSPIIYSRVTEYLGDSLNNVGKTIYYYNPYPEDIDAYAQPNYRSYYQYDHGMYVPELYKKEEYRNIAGQYSLVRSTASSYDVYRSRQFQTGFSLGNTVTALSIGANDPMDAFYSYNSTDQYLQTLEFSESYGYQDKDLITETDVTEYADDGKTFTTKTTYDYDNYLQPIKKATVTSKGDEIEETTTYPEQEASGNPASPNIYDMMVARNMIDASVTITTSKNGNLLQSTTTNFANWPNNLIAPSSVISKVGSAAPDTRITYNAYDSKPNVLSATKGAVTSCYIWDYAHDYPIAKVVNASQNDVAYTSFEADGTGGVYLNNNGAGIISTDAITGTRCYQINNALAKFNLDPTKTYVVSLWWKNGVPPNYNGFNGSTQVIGDNNTWTTGKTVNGWTYLEKTLTGVTTINVGSGGGLVDEVRFFPANAQMTTYTYAPLVGMTSQCDVANRITYYEYDDFNRLRDIKDQDGNIIKTFTYHYKGQ